VSGQGAGDDDFTEDRDPACRGPRLAGHGARRHCGGHAARKHHATPSVDAKVLGLIGVSQTVDAKGCKKGWCQVAGGYVQTSYLRFIRVRKGYENSYDYNVPLALPPYGYAPGFWGYGGRRYYDQFGNYAKYGQRG
jgi:hypothetical protein